MRKGSNYSILPLNLSAYLQKSSDLFLDKKCYHLQHFNEQWWQSHTLHTFVHNFRLISFKIHSFYINKLFCCVILKCIVRMLFSLFFSIWIAVGIIFARAKICHCKIETAWIEFNQTCKRVTNVQNQKL